MSASDRTTAGKTVYAQNLQEEIGGVEGERFVCSFGMS